MKSNRTQIKNFHLVYSKLIRLMLNWMMIAVYIVTLLNNPYKYS